MDNMKYWELLRRSHDSLEINRDVIMDLRTTKVVESQYWDGKNIV